MVSKCSGVPDLPELTPGRKGSLRRGLCAHPLAREGLRRHIGVSSGRSPPHLSPGKALNKETVCGISNISVHVATSTYIYTYYTQKAKNIYIYIHIRMYIFVYIFVFACLCRYRSMNNHIEIYIYIYIHIYILL